MRVDHLRSIDLNLLVVLATLLEERSTTRAAQRLGLTQSATSRALGRLRDLFGDPLFVRGPRGLVATVRAETLAPRVRLALDSASDVLEPLTFNPATARRQFVLGMADLAEAWLMPRLIAAVQVVAPAVDLISFGDARPLEEGLNSGRYDLVVIPNVGESASMRRQALLLEDFVCLLRAEHPALSLPWTLKRFAALGHVLVAPRGTAGGIIDKVLADSGTSRRVVARVGTFGAAPEVVAATDLVTTLPRSLAVAAAARLGLVMREPPLPVPGFTLFQCWLERVHGDPGHGWLRELVHRIANDEASRREASGRMAKPGLKAPARMAKPGLKTPARMAKPGLKTSARMAKPKRVRTSDRG